VKQPLVIIPTYNEAEGIEMIIDRTLAADPRLAVLVVDDSSPDNTAGIVRRHAAFGKRVDLLSRPKKSGLAGAYKQGFRTAAERDFDVCIEMDADLSHDPEDIPRLLAKLDEGFDAVVGSRYLNGVRVMNWPQERLFLSTGASRYVQFLTRLPMTDPTSGFKAMRTSVLSSLDWSRFRAEGYGFQIEIHYALWRGGFRLTEIPIVFTERRAGATKMSPAIAIEAAWRVAILPLAYALRSSRPDQ
jgi:dolichol-phosphate mannosyltransferase